MKKGLTAAACVALLATACGGGTTQPSPSGLTLPDLPTAAQSTSSAPMQTDPARFVGPVFLTCKKSIPNPSPGTTVSKLNLDTNELVTVAQYDVGGCIGSFKASSDLHGNFGAQSLRNLFSPDYQELAVNLNTELGTTGHVGYYDLKTHQYVDVTKLLQPTVADFQDPLKHSDGVFTDDGLFMFHDDLADTFEYFDTVSKKIVKTTPTPDRPRYFQLTAEPISPDAPSYQTQYFYPCYGLWVINDHQYLRVINSVVNNYMKESLAIEEMPKAMDGCDENTGAVISPPASSILGAASDPAASTILFTIDSPSDNAVTLYRADPQDPSHPKEVPVKLGDYADDFATIVEWK